MDGRLRQGYRGRPARLGGVAVQPDGELFRSVRERLEPAGGADDGDAAEWNTEALGPGKRQRAAALLRALRARTAELLSQLEIPLDPEELVGNLAVANQQMVEIAKAVSYNSEVLIMDEPTSSLTEHEVGHLFRIIRQLREQISDNDRAIVEAMNARLKLVARLKGYKESRGL